MKGLLVHGCFDKTTFSTLLSLGVQSFAFDLRARSANLIPFRDLHELLKVSPKTETILMFANDTRETILSSLDLVKKDHQNLILEFRDNQKAEFYESVGVPYLWTFCPEGDWRNILTSDNCRGVLLPLSFQDIYHSLPLLWTLIEENHLRVYLHADNFSETDFFLGHENILASVDLAADVQTSYRTVDQSKLRTMKLWRKTNESTAGQ